MNQASTAPLRHPLALLAATLLFAPTAFSASDQTATKEPVKPATGEVVEKIKPTVVYVPVSPKKNRISKKCDADRKKFCGSVDPGFARVEYCLRENREDLSSECRARIDRMQSDRENNGRVGVVNANEE